MKNNYIEFEYSLSEPVKLLNLKPRDLNQWLSMDMVGTKWVIRTRSEANAIAACDAVSALHRQRSGRVGR